MLWIVDALLFLIDCEQNIAPHFLHSIPTDKCSCRIHCFLISSTPLLSHTTSIYEFMEYFGVFWNNSQIWATWVFSIICVCMVIFKVSIPPLNHCFWQTRVWITLIKPLLCLEQYFSHWKAMLYQHTKFRFFHCFENLQQ